MTIGCGRDSESAGNANTSHQTSKAEPGIIVAVGDSLTAGYGVGEQEAYPALLEKRLVADNYYYRVINAGVSGETSSGTLSRIEWVIQSLNPDMIILETGANDGLRGVDPKVLEGNLDKILTIVRKYGVKILLAGMKLPPNLGPFYSARFAKVYPEIAKKHRVDLIPFFLESVAGDKRYNLSDYIHPNAQGYHRIVDYIYPYVVDVIKELDR